MGVWGETSEPWPVHFTLPKTACGDWAAQKRSSGASAAGANTQSAAWKANSPPWCPAAAT